jgi:TonB family protein
MDILSLPNLLAYSVQVLAVVLLATVMSALLRMDAPGLRYLFWRGVLALCLLLPLLQGRAAPARAAGGSVAVDTGIAVSVAPAASGRPAFDWTAAILPLLVLGATVRLAWLGISFGRLRRLRRRGERAAACGTHEDLAALIGVRSEIRYVDALRQPATFGLRRPVILLPSALAAAPDEVQRAVVSHELFHVKRRDWAWLVAEELVCALLWFHPAIWWAVARVHDARELVVDELAVLATGRRRAYVEALMRFADKTSLAPVAAFGGRRQLFHRIVMLSKERVMSSRRLVLTLGVLTVTLAAGTAQVTRAFPLLADAQLIRQTTPGPLEQRANPVTPENPIPRRVLHEDATYPAEAQLLGAHGNVTLMITLDEIGRVMEARRINLRVSTAEPSATIAFATPSPSEQKFVLNNDVDFSNRMKAAAEAFEAAAIRAVEQWRYDPPAAAPLSFVVSFSLSPTGTSASQSATAMSGGRGRGGASSPQAGGPVRVGSNIATPRKIVHVDPVYPEIARKARVAGLVILEARIGADGSVEDAQVLRSIPLLDQAAIDAVKQWRFRPTLLNGTPVPVIMTVTVNFRPDGAPVEQAVEVAPEGTPAARGRGAVAAPVEAATEVKPQGPLPRVIKDVKATYPQEALAAKVSGTVEVAATVGTDGKVTAARIVRSIPIFDQAALDAVYQWEFAPIARPVEVTIEMSFAARTSR